MPTNEQAENEILRRKLEQCSQVVKRLSTEKASLRHTAETLLFYLSESSDKWLEGTEDYKRIQAIIDNTS